MTEGSNVLIRSAFTLDFPCVDSHIAKTRLEPNMTKWWKSTNTDLKPVLIWSMDCYIIPSSVQFISVTQSCSILCNPHGLQHARPPCLSPTPRAYLNSCALSQWCHPTISSSISPFSSCLQSFPASRSFPMS